MFYKLHTNVKNFLHYQRENSAKVMEDYQLWETQN